MAPPTLVSKKVRNLDDILSDRVVKSPKKGNGKSPMVARKRSQRIRNRTLGPSNASCPIVLSRFPSPVLSPSSSPPAPISPPRVVPACDDDCQIPLGEVEYYAPNNNRRFGQGAPLGAKFGTLKSYYGPQVPRRLVKKNNITEQRETHLEPASKLPRVNSPQPSLPQYPSTQRSILPRQGNSQTSLSYSQSKSKSVASSSNSQPRPGASTNSICSRVDTPAVSEDDEPEAPLLSTVHLHELDSVLHRSQSPQFSDPPLSPEDAVGDNAEAPAAVAPKSIRQKSKPLPTEGEPAPAKKKRGIVNNHKLGQEVEQLGPDKRLRVEVGPDGKNPASAHIKSLSTHAVGSYVKAVLPMNVASFSHYPDPVWKQMLVHIGCSFEINEQAWLKSLILKMAADRFREWKRKCSSFYRENPDVVPDEFAHRRHEWDWLVSHFNDPAFQAKSSQMKKLRVCENWKTHHSGKLGFNYRAERHLKNGHKAAHLAAFLEVYAADPKAAHLVEKMKKKLAELMNGETDLDALVDPMPLQIQLDIIDEIMDRRTVKGTRGPPKKVQAFLDIHEELDMTREELRKEQIEAARKQEESRALIQSLADRIKALEDKGGNAAGKMHEKNFVILV